MKLDRFNVDRGVSMAFIVKMSPTPIYSSRIIMINKIKIDSRMNYRRKRRLEEYKTIRLATLKGRTLRDISIEEG